MWDERPSLGNVAAVAITGSAVLAVVVLPPLSVIFKNLSSQVAAASSAYNPNVARPGESYFLQFYHTTCAPGALWSLYAPRSFKCDTIWHVIVGALGAAISILAMIGMVLGGRRLFPVSLCAMLPFAAGTYMLVARHYDYAAFKIFTASFPFGTALAVYGASKIRPMAGRFAVSSLLCAYAVAVGFRVYALDLDAPTKTVEAYSASLSIVPDGEIVALKIADHASYQWASYYLRDHDILTLQGNLPYLPKPKTAPPSRSPTYLVSDQPVDDCWGEPVSRGPSFAVYHAEACNVRLQ